MRVLVILLILSGAFAESALAGSKGSIGGAVSSPSGMTQSKDDAQNNDNKQTLDCSRPNNDWRCKRGHPPPSPYPYSYPSYRARPVIINQIPAEPAVEIQSLTDDWEGCRKAKIGSMSARDKGDSTQANRLEEWLWKNCRGYSNELRQMEQDGL